jgi:hypothetical protein
VARYRNLITAWTAKTLNELNWEYIAVRVVAQIEAFLRRIDYYIVVGFLL